MDYNYYSRQNFLSLVLNFDGISLQLLKKIRQLTSEGFKLENGFMFGFSYGAHLVYWVGTEMNGQIAVIHGMMIERFNFIY